MKARDFVRCKECRVLMTWPHAKKIFNKLIKSGMLYMDVKKIAPLCNKCLVNYVGVGVAV